MAKKSKSASGALSKGAKKAVPAKKVGKAAPALKTKTAVKSAVKKGSVSAPNAKSAGSAKSKPQAKASAAGKAGKTAAPKAPSKAVAATKEPVKGTKLGKQASEVPKTAVAPVAAAAIHETKPAGKANGKAPAAPPPGAVKLKVLNGGKPAAPSEPTPEAVEATDKTEKKKKKSDFKFDRSGNLEEQWKQIFEKLKALKPVPYKMSDNYEAQTVLTHKVLGWGYILTSQNNRLEVLFKDGIKILIANYKA